MSYRANPQPAPQPTPITAPFWAATKDRKLLLQRCQTGHIFYYPRSHCPECLSNDLTWIEASGKGTVYSYTVARRAQSPEFADDIPYIIAAITLEEGPRMTSLLVEADPEDVQVETRVEVVWEDSDTVAFPYFRPAP